MDRSPRGDVTFEDLYHERWVPLVHLAALTTGSQALAEEIVQDAFVQLYRNWLNIDHPRAWLRVAVVNGCTGWVRRQTLERRHEATVVEQAHDEPDDAIAIRTALDALSRRQRIAVVLRYYEDLPEVAIAEALGCRPGTVKSLLARAAKKLERELQP